MDFERRRWRCQTCGRQSEVGLAPDERGDCERCAEAALGRRRLPNPAPLTQAPDDFRRRGIVARLRERYAEAREIAPSTLVGSEHHEHLNWILGEKRSAMRDDADLDAGVSELVVLWLEDFVLELDGPWAASLRETIAAPPEASRRLAADGLRAAAKDFAEAFLSPRQEVLRR